MGHSWGSILGILTVQKSPDLFYAYIGLGQDASSWEKTISTLTSPNMIDYPTPATIVDGNQFTYENIYRAFSSYTCQSQLIHFSIIYISAFY